MRLRISARLEAVRTSLFLIPMLAVVGAVLAGLVSLAVDRHLDSGSARLPLGASSTVDSARAVLSTIAAATISFAGIAFSVSLLTIQLASSQYSPRVVHTLFRDPYNKRVMALVVGTFTYCVVVLRSVRSSLEDGGDPVIPNLSVAVAVVLGIATILALVAFINHSAHTMDVSEILDRVRRHAVSQVQKEWTPLDERARGDQEASAEPVPDPDRPQCVIRFDRSGWFQQFDPDALLSCTPEGGVLRLTSYPGRYAIEGAPMATLSPPPEDEDVTAERIRAAISLGETRTLQQDMSYGLRQLVDIALKALSPGINDPTTAQDAIFHAASVLGELLRHDPPSAHRTADGSRHLIIEEQPTHDELIALTFEEIRRAAASQPTVAIYVLEAQRVLVELLEGIGRPERGRALAEQARLLVVGCAAADLIPSDLALVRSAYAKRFPNGD